MVPITEDWIKDIIKAGEALNTTALRHNIDTLRVVCEPEFGYVRIEGSQIDADDNATEVFSATQWRDFEPTIKIAPQGAATPTGAKDI